MEQKTNSAVLQFIRNRMRKGRLCIILIVGEQRLGKTMTGIRLAYDIESEGFILKDQLKVNALDFMLAYDRLSRKILIYDEAGKDLDPYRVMDDVNRAISHVIQTQAYKYNVAIFILPFAVDLAKGHRKHVKLVIHVTGRGIYKAYGTYVWHANLNEVPIRMIPLEEKEGVPLPPENLVTEYIDTIEKVTKQDIMRQEIDKLKRRDAKLNEANKSMVNRGLPPKKPPLQLPAVTVVQ